MTLIQPLRLFLDTNHLVNLTHLRLGRPLRGSQGEERVQAYWMIDEWLRTGQCVPVFCETMSYEWVRQKDPAAPQQIAAVFDKSVATKRILPDPLIFIVEAMNECQRIEPEIGFPGFEVVRDLGPDIDFVRWCNDCWPVPEERPAIVEHRARPGVAGIVELIAEDFQRGRDKWRESLDAEKFKLAKAQELQRQEGASDTLQKVKGAWPRAVLVLDRFLQKMAPHLDPEGILRHMSIDRCPSLDLHIDAHWAYARGERRFEENDFVDLTMLAVLPHVDVALIEGGIHDLVRQVRRTEYANLVFRDPVALVESVSARL